MKKILAILLAMMLVAVSGCAKKVEETKKEDPKPEYTVREGFVTDLEDIIKMEYTNNEVTITLDNVDEAWFHADDHDTWLNQSILMSLEKTAGQMAYLEEIKTFTSLADYGLDKPAYTITMENKDGFIVKLFVGNAVEGEQTCYVTTGDKEVVYKVSDSIFGYLEFDKEKLIAVEVDPMQYLQNQEEPTDELIGDDIEETPVDTAPEESTPAEGDTVDPEDTTPPNESVEQPAE